MGPPAVGRPTPAPVETVDEHPFLKATVQFFPGSFQVLGQSLGVVNGPARDRLEVTPEPGRQIRVQEEEAHEEGALLIVVGPDTGVELVAV